MGRNYVPIQSKWEFWVIFKKVKWELSVFPSTGLEWSNQATTLCMAVINRKEKLQTSTEHTSQKKATLQANTDEMLKDVIFLCSQTLRFFVNVKVKNQLLHSNPAVWGKSSNPKERPAEVTGSLKMIKDLSRQRMGLVWLFLSNSDTKILEKGTWTHTFYKED